VVLPLSCLLPVWSNPLSNLLRSSPHQDSPRPGPGSLSSAKLMPSSTGLHICSSSGLTRQSLEWEAELKHF
jgi:hypothetical protein